MTQLLVFWVTSFNCSGSLSVDDTGQLVANRIELEECLAHGGVISAAAQQAVATAFASALDTLQKTQQAQDAYISSMDSQYQAHDTGGGPGLKGDMMPAGSGLDDKGTEAATAEYMRLQDGTQRNMIDAASRFATGAPLASPLATKGIGFPRSGKRIQVSTTT